MAKPRRSSSSDSGRSASPARSHKRSKRETRPSPSASRSPAPRKSRRSSSPPRRTRKASKSPERFRPQRSRSPRERRRRSPSKSASPVRRKRSPSPPRRRDRSPEEKRDRRRGEDSHRNRRHRSSPSVKKEIKDEPRDASQKPESRRNRPDKFAEPKPHPSKKPPGPSDKYAWGKEGDNKEPTPPPEGEDEVEKLEPTFELSGALAVDTNKVKGVVLKHTEPGDAAKSKTIWMWYVFSGDEFLEKMYLHRESSYLIGRHPKLADIPMHHPSISTQHAVLQYRRVDNRIRPYIMDLGSSNGTTLNGTKLEAQRYYELKEQDVVKVGFSTRDYVLLNENSVKKDE